MIAYVVLTHTHPALVDRLVARLLDGDPDCRVVVEHDASGPPLALARRDRLTVRTAPRPGGWGGYGLVAAVLRSLRDTVAPLDPDWVVLLSGQDYPLRPPAEIARRLAAEEHDALLDLWRVIPDRDRPGDAWWRARYFMRWYRLPLLPRTPLHVRRLGLQRRLSFAQPFVFLWTLPRGAGTRIGFRRRRTPFGPDLPCRGGSQWFALSRRALRSLLERATPELEAFYARTIIPDESFFNTIVSADPALRIADGNLTFTRMEGDGEAHAAILDVDDLPALQASGKAFARRMDPERSAGLLDALDATSG